MHNVGFAEPTDIMDMKAMWRMAFLDSDDNIQYFFDHLYKEGYGIVSREEGVPVGCLYLIPCQFVLNYRLYSAYYIYAATTHPSHRNKGHMAAMLHFAEEVATERGIDFLVVVPADDQLYDYYGKYGYQTAFYKKVVRFTREQLKALAVPPDLTNAFSLDVFDIRQQSLGFGDYINWGDRAIRYAMYSHDASSGSMAFTSDGYAMYNMGKDTVYVKEMCTLSDPGELYTMLLMEDEAEKFTLNLPVNSNIHSDDEHIERAGMCLALSETSMMAMRDMRNAYLGLTLG